MAGMPTLALDRIEPNPRNVRTDLGDLTELAASIRARGVQQPLIVVRRPGGQRLLLLDGHRRYAAARLAGLAAVPVIVSTDVTAEQQDAHMIAAAMHKGLTPLEQARAFARLRKRGHLVATIAARTGYSESTISERLALLNLPLEAQRQLERGDLTTTSAVDLARQVAATGRGQARVRTAVRPAWFAKHHALAPRLECTHTDTRRVVGPACGPCWEQAIRADERAKVLADLDETEAA